MYLCRLIEQIKNQEIEHECFYREGDSRKEVQEGLDLFQWDKGQWYITLADEDE
jgi:hypothetical protein